MTDEDTREYELRDGIQSVTAADVSIDGDETVELTEDEAEQINDRHPDPILQPVDDVDEDDGGEA